MARRREQWVLWFLHVCIAALFLAGCLTKPPVAPYSFSDEVGSEYRLTNKIPLKVKLYLSNELRAGAWQQKDLPQSYKRLFGGMAAYYLGEGLARNAEQVTQAIFSTVVATWGGNGGPGPEMAGCDAVLIPRIVTMDWGGFSGALTLTVLLEWTLQDEHGNIIWVDTLTGEGEAEIPVGHWEEKSGPKALHNATLKDLFHKSFSALSSSQAIRDFAAKHANPSLNHD